MEEADQRNADILTEVFLEESITPPIYPNKSYFNSCGATMQKTVNSSHLKV